MRHRALGRRAVPMESIARTQQDVARSELLDRTILNLRPTNARSDDQRLPERMGVPRRPRPGLERHDRAGPWRRLITRELSANRHVTGEVLRRSFDFGLRVP